MPLTLYGSPDSGSAAVEMGLRAAQVGYEFVHASSWEPGPAMKQLLGVNPLGQIPAPVLPDGTVLCGHASP